MEQEIKKLFEKIEQGAEVTITSFSKKNKNKHLVIRSQPCNDIIYVEDKNRIGLRFCFAERLFSFEAYEKQIKFEHNVILTTKEEDGYYREIMVTPITQKTNLNTIDKWKLLKKRKNLTKQDIFREDFYQNGI